MSKTLEENLTLKAAQIYLKRFAAWVIGLKNRYRQDPFFRTEWNVLFLQVVFAATLLVVFYINLVGVLEANTFNLILLSAVVVTFLSGYIIARVALKPARNAYTSHKRFISDIAHELRTPLSIIKANNEVILMDKRPLDHSLRKTVKSSIEELNRISEIINNLLTLNNLLQPERMAFSNIDLGQVVDRTITKLIDSARNKQIEMIVKKTGPVVVWGNATALEQIVLNLVKNAISYTHVGGRITVSVASDYQGNVLLEVSDNGMGISQEDLFHIFQPFYRAERSRKRQAGSSGLGLTIVSELVKLHAGRITIKSALNRGTSVLVFFRHIKDKTSVDRRKLNEISVDFTHRVES